jgi:hypothetical protein
MNLPPFPTDAGTLDLLEAALNGTGQSEQSSVNDLCVFYSELGGADSAAVESDLDGTQVMRDPQYHPNDIIAALIAEVRQLRSTEVGK